MDTRPSCREPQPVTGRNRCNAIKPNSIETNPDPGGVAESERGLSGRRLLEIAACGRQQLWIKSPTRTRPIDASVRPLNGMVDDGLVGQFRALWVEIQRHDNCIRFCDDQWNLPGIWRPAFQFGIQIVAVDLELRMGLTSFVDPVCPFLIFGRSFC